jgi:hypothetical protein
MHLRARFFRRLAAAALGATSLVAPVSAAPESSLRAVKGEVGHQSTPDGPFSRIFGSYLVRDDEFAVTHPASNGMLVLPDSSEIALGAATTVGVGAIERTAADAPHALHLVVGSIRFDVRHPAGQAANYLFRTPTSQLAIRGTIGLIFSGPDGDLITCLKCDAGDATIDAGGATYALLTGQTATISPQGATIIRITRPQTIETFRQAGLDAASASNTPFVEAAGVSSY